MSKAKGFDPRELQAKDRWWASHKREKGVVWRDETGILVEIDPDLRQWWPFDADFPTITRVVREGRQIYPKREPKRSLTLAEYMASEDGNAFWRLEAGDHLNLLEEAIEEIERLRRQVGAADQVSSAYDESQRMGRRAFWQSLNPLVLHDAQAAREGLAAAVKAYDAEKARGE